jgi:hypothetical protein
MPNHDVQTAGFSVRENGQSTFIPYAGLRAFHSDGNLAMLAITFQSLRGALPQLAKRGPAQRHKLSVTTGHPGSGVRDAFEYVTRAVTRGVYTLDREMTIARLNPHADFAYAWVLHDGPNALLCQLREDILSPRFFELFGLKKSGALSEADVQEFERVKHHIETLALSLDPEDMFQYEEI